MLSPINPPSLTMNIYFIDPTYIKPEIWEPLLNFLKVKVVYSFIELDELHDSLRSKITPNLKISFHNRGIKKFTDLCVFSLKAHLEKHVHLIVDEDENKLTKEEVYKLGTKSAYHNLKDFDIVNCLILVRLNSTEYSANGTILAPTCYIDELEDTLPTYIAKYCLNILRKKHQHSKYNQQTAFVIFDTFFSRAFYLERPWVWRPYTIKNHEGSSKSFTKKIAEELTEITPHLFSSTNPSQQNYSPFITDEGNFEYNMFLDILQEYIREGEEAEKGRIDALEWRNQVSSWTRDFWEEVGDSWVNCD